MREREFIAENNAVDLKTWWKLTFFGSPILFPSQHVMNLHWSTANRLRMLLSVFKAISVLSASQSGIPLQLEHTYTHRMLCCRITTLTFYIF